MELAGQGIDVIDAAFDYKLGANLETLFLLTGAVVGTGNAGANNIFDASSGTNNKMFGLGGDDVLEGVFGDDTLDGGTDNDLLNGGDDNDSLIGGAGNDVLNGDAGNDRLNGDAGNDTLWGAVGGDTAAGGIGNDLYQDYDGTDTLVEFLGQGTDTVESLISVTKLFDNIENLTLLGANLQGGGNALNNVITGTGGADTLSGDAGNDTLIGGAGADSMAGGTGNDTFEVDDSNDVVSENSKEGTDTIRSFTDFDLSVGGINVENLTLLLGATFGTGNAAANVITGNDNGNSLDGGVGADTLIGGKGGDIYVIDEKGDRLVELANQGFDKVQSPVRLCAGCEFRGVGALPAAPSPVPAMPPVTNSPATRKPTGCGNSAARTRSSAATATILSTVAPMGTFSMATTATTVWSAVPAATRSKAARAPIPWPAAPAMTVISSMMPRMSSWRRSARASTSSGVPWMSRRLRRTSRI